APEASLRSHDRGRGRRTFDGGRLPGQSGIRTAGQGGHGMRVAALGVRLAILLLPRRIRGRYREEWHADLAGAPEAGLSAWNVALGALLFSITLDRRAPELSGLSVAVTARRRARWGIAFLLSAGVLW